MTAAEALEAMRALPVAPLDAVTQSGTVLILAPHPDDESLGCGGLIAAACKAGTPPYVMIMTDGAGSHPNSRLYPPARLRRMREQEAQDAVAQLGLPPDRIGFLGLPDTAAPTAGPAFDAAVFAIRNLADRIGAATVLAPWQHDPHCDHEATHLIAAATGLRHLAYPVWGWTLPDQTILPGRIPTGTRLDIARHLAAKDRAIAAHRSQYAGVITDDPAGFQLPASLLDAFKSPFETFLMVHAPAT